MQKYDLIIIGSGPAGQKSAISMAKRGHSVLIVERGEKLGGGCLHTGTIPSKTMREIATQFSKARISISKPITISDIQNKLDEVISNELNIVNNQLKRNHIDVVFGTASFIDKNTITVAHDKEIKKFHATFFLIATGSSPNRPDNIPFDDTLICDSDSILKMKEIPPSIIIVGAGVIGSEYACIFSEMGVKVHLINKYKDILNFVDIDIRKRLMDEMKLSGIFLHSEAAVTSIKKNIRGQVQVLLKDGKIIEAPKLLYCQGRKGNIKDLNLNAVQIPIEKYDLINVNNSFQTCVDNIYACGDVIGYPSLASVSSEQGRLAVFCMLGLKVPSLAKHSPYGIYTIPEISFVGKNEKELKEKNIPFVTGVSDFKEIARGQIYGQSKGLLKLHFHKKSLKLLGVHIIGLGASDLVHIGQAVLAFHGTLNYFLYSVFNYPTLAEAYKVAALSAYNQLSKSYITSSL